MLNRIQLTNFKRHEALTINFEEGLTAIKGANEAGKSTLIQAVAYALFGAKALPQPLEEIVTYEKPVNTLKVVLDFVVDGVSYSISRGKSGAELNYAGGTVTGQNETSAFIGKLLGSDAQAASRLFLANQGDIRGTLGDGAKAVQLIERLAEFDQLDRLVDLIQGNLVTGGTTAAEATLAQAQEQLDTLEKVEEPDLQAIDKEVERLEAVVTSATEQAGRATTRHREATAALSQAREANADIAACIRNVEESQRRLAAAKEDLRGLKKVAPVDDSAIADLEAEVARAEAALALKTTFKGIQVLLGTEPEYEGSLETLEKEIDVGRKQAEAWRLERSALANKAATAEALKVAGSCSLCGKDVSEVPEVVAKNAKLDAEAAEAKEKSATIAAKLAQWTKDETELQAIKTKARPVLAAANRWACDHLKVDLSVTPPALSWTGPTDFEAAEAALAKASAALKDLRAKKEQAVAAEAARTQASKRVDAAQADVEHAQARLAGRAPVPTKPLEDEAAAAEGLVQELRQEAESAKVALVQQRSGRKDAITRWESHLRLRAQLEGTVSKAKEDLRVLQFNNALLKAVRGARPVIADKLWALVLGAVSKYFSNLRGDNAVVTKSSDGFAVNGRSVAGLSGSTQDILGLAVRVALLRTFIPQATLMVLDEPTAAMDAERTATTLGFLASTGFRQTLIVSHEEATEAVADHLIQL